MFWPREDELIARRRALLREHRQLIQRQWARLIGVEQPTAVVVAERMRTLKTFDQLKDIDAGLAFLVVCNSVLRLSIRKGDASHGDPADVAPRIEGMLHTLRRVLRIFP